MPPVLSIFGHAAKKTTLFRNKHSAENKNKSNELGVWKKANAGRISSEQVQCNNEETKRM
jgi:hypothetical protein